MEMVLLLVGAALVAGPGVWMAVAVLDNWVHPRMNEEAVAMVVRMDLMAAEYPEEYRLVANRRIEDPAKIRLLFRMMRLAETVAAITLLASACLLCLAAAGWIAVSVALGASIAALGFYCSIWAGFIIGGNYFVYWFCHQWAQQNHFMFLAWGLLVLIALPVLLDGMF